MRLTYQALGVTGLAWLLCAGILPGVAAAAEGAAGSGSRVAVAPARNPGGSEMADMMRRMQAIHQELRLAKTPAERAVLLEQHMKLIDEGVTMLQQLHARSGEHTPEQAMQDRMDMIAMLMRMMVDREGALTGPMAPPCMNPAPAAPAQK